MVEGITVLPKLSTGFNVNVTMRTYLKKVCKYNMNNRPWTIESDSSELIETAVQAENEKE